MFVLVYIDSCLLLVKEDSNINLFISSLPDDGYEYIFEGGYYPVPEYRLREYIRDVTGSRIINFVDISS